MSVMAIFCLILSVLLHACTARVFPASFQLPGKEVEIMPAPRLMIKLNENLSAETETRKIEASEEDQKDNKGNEIRPLPITEELLQKTADQIQFQEQKRQERTMIESESEPPADKSEETVFSKENDMGEDIDEMDYAQPHRKPPIHNKEP